VIAIALTMCGRTHGFPTVAGCANASAHSHEKSAIAELNYRERK
jgi:hypothetical protein